MRRAPGAGRSARFGVALAEPLKLSAIVAATNRPATLDACLAAIRAAADTPEELLVVDRPLGAGPSWARNDGAGRATGDVLVFVDADVAVHADVFRRVRAAFASDERLTAVFGSYDDSPAAPGVVSGFRNLLHHHVHQAGAGAAQTFWAGLGAVRRDAFLAAGGFDADGFPQASIEDVDLGLRLTDGGARIRLDPALQGMHLKRWGLGEMIRTDVFRRGAPWVALLARRRSVPAELNLGWRHRASAGLVLGGLAAALARRPLTAGAALGALVLLNRSFYALVARRRGRGDALAAVGLHAVHHLAAAVAVPVGLLAYVRGSAEARSSASRSSTASPSSRYSASVFTDQTS
jgi:GT2 family glycosyltransferase